MRIFWYQIEVFIILKLEIFLATSKICQSVICQSGKLRILLNEHVFLSHILNGRTVEQ